MGDGLIVTNVEKSYGSQSVLKRTSFTVKEGEFVSIIGKSGSGKSTLLRLIAGLETMDSGTITLNQLPIDQQAAAIRMMFQDGRLLPWKTVMQNLLLGRPKREAVVAQKLLAGVGLASFTTNYPDRLSGGQQQRVALARALMHRPSVLLLDEPLGALDAFTRQEMQELLKTICTEQHMTTVLVTHDIEEAVFLSDRILVLDEGDVVKEFTVELPTERVKTDAQLQHYVHEILALFGELNQKKLLM